MARRRVGGDRDDQRPVAAAGRRPGETCELGRLGHLERPGSAGHDVEPDRIGPGGDRGEDPVGVGDPADLDEGPTRDVGRVVWRGAGRDERPYRGGGIGRADQRLADERAIDPERAPARDRRRLADARLGDHEPIVGDVLAQPGRPLDVDLERPQVPVVEPDQPRAAGKGALQLALVVDLDEWLEPDLACPLDETGEPPRRMEDREEQDQIGAGGAEERELDLLDHEVLGEDRDGDRRADRSQVVDRAAEPVRFAEDRDRRRAAGFVGPGTGDDVLAGDRDPSGRRR